jgi:hypothetical protein
VRIACLAPQAAGSAAPRARLWSVALALVVGAFVGAVFGALLLIVAGALPQPGGAEPAIVPSNLLFAYFIFVFTAPAALAIGIPAYFVLTRWRMLNAVSVAAVGAASGAAIGTLLQRGAPSDAGLLTCAAIGLASALAALFVLVHHPRARHVRPDEAMG